MSDNHHEEAHTGPIKTPKQPLVAGFLSFVVPIFAIIGLVLYVSSSNKPAPGASNPEKALAERIQKVGMVEVRDANRPLRAGEEVYRANVPLPRHGRCGRTQAGRRSSLGPAHQDWF